MFCKVTHCAGCISASTRPYQLCWGYQEVGTAISCTECSQMAGLIQNLVDTSQKHNLFMQLFFVQLSFIQRSYVVTIIVDHHVLSVHKQLHARVHKEVLEVPEVLMYIMSN